MKIGILWEGALGHVLAIINEPRLWRDDTELSLWCALITECPKVVFNAWHQVDSYKWYFFFQVMDVSINYNRRILGIPLLSFKDRGTYVESNTKVYDEMAFKYLGMAFFPLLGGYCLYSLFYHEHKGWYSFVLSMLYGFLLTFGEY